MSDPIDPAAVMAAHPPYLHDYADPSCRGCWEFWPCLRYQEARDAEIRALGYDPGRIHDALYGKPPRHEETE